MEVRPSHEEWISQWGVIEALLKKTASSIAGVASEKIADFETIYGL